MEIFYFLCFVAAGAIGLMWMMRKPRPDIELARKKRAEKRKTHAKILETPIDSIESNPGGLGHTQRHSTASGVASTSRFVPKSAAPDGPQYDGYSRRDRHHLMSSPAHVKKEAHIEDDDYKLTSKDFTQKERPAS